MRTTEAPPPNAQRLLQEVRRHPKMSNGDLAKLLDMTRNNVHQWKRVFAKAGLIDNGNEVARANSTTENLGT